MSQEASSSSSLEEMIPFAEVPQQTIAELYALAYWLYGNRDYGEATSLFRILATARPSEPKYWKGLGACLQMQKEYQEAIKAYSSAEVLHLKTKDPYLYVHKADCYLALKQIGDALQALQTARVYAKQKKNDSIVRHVTFMQQIWSSPSEVVTNRSTPHAVNTKQSGKK